MRSSDATVCLFRESLSLLDPGNSGHHLLHQSLQEHSSGFPEGGLRHGIEEKQISVRIVSKSARRLETETTRHTCKRRATRLGNGGDFNLSHCMVILVIDSLQESTVELPITSLYQHSTTTLAKMNNLSQRPALGQLASVGTFFNKRTDSFLPLSLLKQELPLDVIAKSPAALDEKLKVDLSYNDTYEQKFDMLGIEPDMRGSILAGIISPGAAGRYLDEVRENSNDLHAAIYHKIVSCVENLYFMSSSLQDCLTSTTIQ